jgi:hypothetical protein
LEILVVKSTENWTSPPIISRPERMLEHECRGDACFAEGIVTLIVYHLVFMVT